MKFFAGVCAVLVAAAIVARPAAAPSSAVFTRGLASCHALAFTFDLCPVKEGSGFDTALVNFLIEHKVHATFFASGRWIDAHDREIRELAAQPFFEIGTHGQAHAHMKTMTADAQSTEIRGPIATLAKKYSVRATLFRPPYGEYNDETVQAAGAAGQTVVMWSVVSGDPDPKLKASAIIADVVGRVRNGSVIVFHANGRGWHTSETVPEVYQQLVVKKQFATDTISELRSCEGKKAKGTGQR